jgi:hypothetical protein
MTHTYPCTTPPRRPDLRVRCAERARIGTLKKPQQENSVLRRNQLPRTKAMHAPRQKTACELSDSKRRTPVHRDSAADIPDVLPFATQGEVSTAVKEELDDLWA